MDQVPFDSVTAYIDQNDIQLTPGLFQLLQLKTLLSLARGQSRVNFEDARVIMEPGSTNVDLLCTLIQLGGLKECQRFKYLINEKDRCVEVVENDVDYTMEEITDGKLNDAIITLKDLKSRLELLNNEL